MDILPNVIRSLSKEEIRAYKLYTKRTGNSNHRKDIELFNLIKHSNILSHENNAGVIYNNSRIDTKYYRLKNKVSDDIGLVLVNLNHKKEIIDVIHNFSLAKIYKEKKEFRLSLHYIQIAEKKALGNENYSMLDVIYEFMLQLSVENSDINPLRVIKKREDNIVKHKLIQELENNYSTLSYQIKTTQNFTVNTAIKKQIKKTIDKIRRLPVVKNSNSLKLKTFQNLIRLLVLIKDYSGLHQYLTESLHEFDKQKLFTKNNHHIKLELLVYLCNANYIIKNYKDSIATSNILYIEMQKFNRLHYTKYLFYYYNSMINTYSHLNINKAIDLLEQCERETSIVNNKEHYFYILINLAGLNFNTNKYKNAAKNISKIYINPNFKTFDASIKIKILLFEIAIRIELKEYDMCRKQLKQIYKLTDGITKKEPVKYELQVLSIIEELLEAEKPGWNTCSDKIKRFISKYPDAAGYLEYSTWLNDKVKQ